MLERGSPFIFPEVGVYVPLCPVKADLSRDIRKDIEPAPCPLVLSPYPELAEHKRGKWE